MERVREFDFMGQRDITMSEVSDLPAQIYSAFDSDEDFAELLLDFESSMRERRTLLAEAHANRDLESLRKLAHQLKGAGGGYGFDGLSSASADLEQACKGDNNSRIDAMFNLVFEYLGRIRVSS